MIVYGRNPVREALRGRRRVHRVYATERGAREVWLGDVDVVRAEAHELEERCGSPDHQGVCAETEAYPYADADSLLDADDALVVCLDEVQDPHNLGAVCRVAEAAGCAGVVLPERRSAEVTPAVCKASAGAVEHLLVARVRNLGAICRSAAAAGADGVVIPSRRAAAVTAAACKASAGAVEHLAVARVGNLERWLSGAKEAGAWVYGADADAPGAYTAADLTGKVVLVVGGEGKGLRRLVAERCDLLVSIPLRGQVDSLNVATAASVLLFEAMRQRSVA